MMGIPMGKKLPTTPRSRARAAIRQLWLRSRERAAALKQAEYKCQLCGIKQSTAKGKEVKLEVHHNNGITNWEHVLDSIYRHILCDPEHLTVLCKACHEEEHKEKNYE